MMGMGRLLSITSRIYSSRMLKTKILADFTCVIALDGDGDRMVTVHEYDRAHIYNV